MCQAVKHNGTKTAGRRTKTVHRTPLAESYSKFARAPPADEGIPGYTTISYGEDSKHTDAQTRTVPARPFGVPLQKLNQHMSTW